VEKKIYDLCREVLRRMSRAGILDRIILVGSWCVLLYEDYFRESDYRASIRTRDIEFLIPLNTRFKEKTDLFALLQDLGFIMDYKGADGYIRFQHPDLILEFLAPDRGRGSRKPLAIPALGINAQQLRFMDLLVENAVRVMFEGVAVTVPHPANFALHKLLIASRRRDAAKGERDRAQAVGLLKALMTSGESSSAHHVFAGLPRSWQKTIQKELSALGEAENLLPPDRLPEDFRTERRTRRTNA
jgi:hypothetical protein